MGDTISGVRRCIDRPRRRAFGDTTTESEVDAAMGSAQLLRRGPGCTAVRGHGDYRLSSRKAAAPRSEPNCRRTRALWDKKWH
jgi:hypothetical protein